MTSGTDPLFLNSATESRPLRFLSARRKALAFALAAPGRRTENSAASRLPLSSVSNSSKVTAQPSAMSAASAAFFAFRDCFGAAGMPV